jgi:radical SAM protein with 4Fe4S-binding SPASM domain
VLVLALDDLIGNREHFRLAVAEGAPYCPVYVKIKLTWRCNLRCAMCNVWRQSREDRLSLPVIHRLADELAVLGTLKVHLSGGEVLLRPDIFEVIDAFAGRGIQVNLTTNGTLLTEALAYKLAESGVHNLSVSLDGARPAVHDALRGKGSWKRTMQGLRRLRRAAKHASRKLHIRVNCVVTRRNYQDLAGIPEVAGQAGADRLTLIPVDDPDDRLRLNKERIRQYNQEIAPVLAGRALAQDMLSRAEEAYPFGVSSSDLEWSKAGMYALGLYQTQPCYMPWLHALIDPQGKVYACCMLRSTPRLGNVFETGGFRAVWEGAAFRDFRQRMLDLQWRPTLCHACDDFLEENRWLHRLV